MPGPDTGRASEYGHRSIPVTAMIRYCGQVSRLSVVYIQRNARNVRNAADATTASVLAFVTYFLAFVAYVALDGNHALVAMHTSILRLAYDDVEV